MSKNIKKEDWFMKAIGVILGNDWNPVEKYKYWAAFCHALGVGFGGYEVWSFIG